VAGVFAVRFEKKFAPRSRRPFRSFRSARGGSFPSDKVTGRGVRGRSRRATRGADRDSSAHQCSPGRSARFYWGKCDLIQVPNQRARSSVPCGVTRQTGFDEVPARSEVDASGFAVRRAGVKRSLAGRGPLCQLFTSIRGSGEGHGGGGNDRCDGGGSGCMLARRATEMSPNAITIGTRYEGPYDDR
jgi:hypothetical protein